MDAGAAVARWLARRPTPLCWVTGPAGSGKSAAVEAALAELNPAVLPLGAFSVDRCLWRLLGGVTQARLLDFAAALPPRVLVLDALDELQDDGSVVTDLRVRTLLARAGTAIVVTSRAPPPADLPAEAVTTIELEAAAPPIAAVASSPVLEALAASRWASSGWMLGLAAGLGPDEPSLETPPAVLAALDDAGTAVKQVLADGTGEWFQLADSARPSYLAAARAQAVHEAFARVLVGGQATDYVDLVEPLDAEAPYDLGEIAIRHLVAAGDFESAARCYWQWLGNFAVLSRGRLHRGARICRVLNGGLPPDRVAPGLDAIEWRTPVFNDWGQFALCAGDPATSIAAATLTYRTAAEATAEWDLALLACHVADAHLIAGSLSEAREWTERAQDHATQGLRATEGVPTAETMAAVDDAAQRAIAIAARTDGAPGVAREFDALIAVHRRQRGVLERLNRAPLAVPLPGPTGDFDPERLLDSVPAALLAVLEGRSEDARRIVAERLSLLPDDRRDSRFGLVLRTLGHRAGDTSEPIGALTALADVRDDPDARCELAVLEARALLADGATAEALAVADEALVLATERGLGLRRIDLQVVRSEILLSLGREQEAREAAEAADGSPPIEPEAPVAARRTAPEEPPPRSREELHEAALEALAAYRGRGAPFALYLRGFGTAVAHGPFEFGPRLLENALRDALPPGTAVVSIQDHGSVGMYSGAGTALDRGAPSLLLGDDEWEAVVEELIRYADLIVSEFYLLTPGVRIELEAAFRLGRWDRTVLVLPPLESPFELLDGEELVQLFPRCVWADAFHTDELAGLPEIADLIGRIGAIAADPHGEAHPVGLLSLASHYEGRVSASTVFGDQTDERVRYYGFWRLFRAAAIRGVALAQGNDTPDNRLRMADDQLEMAVVLTDVVEEADLIVLTGDLAFAEQLAVSAYNLVGEDADHLRAKAERVLGTIERVRHAMTLHPERFEARPRFGPFLARRSPA